MVETGDLNGGQAAAGIQFDGDGFIIPSSGRVLWLEVQEVLALKRDLSTVDEICVVFRLAEGDVWISETDKGYATFVEVLPDHFPGLNPAWFLDIAFPAFVENRTILWCSDITNDSTTTEGPS